jgi:hypothetical protein
MSGICDGLHDVLPFVECGVVHDNDGLTGEFGDKIAHRPGMENIGVNIGVE